MFKNSKTLIALLVLSMLLAACGAPATAAPTQAPVMTQAPVATEAPTANAMCMGAASGDEISMMYQWSGVEEENLNKILQPFLDAWKTAGAEGLVSYKAGSEGPVEADELLARDGRHWRKLT